MPQDLPGFYFDAEKNRYFPTKGPIPGSSRNSSPASTSTTTLKSISKSNKVDQSCRRIRKKTFKLLQLRELCGDLIPCNRGNISFQEEYQRIQASQPIVWKFQGTERIGVSAMELIHVNIDRPSGLSGTDILFAATANGSLSSYVVGKVRQQFDNGIRCMPDRVWPLSTEEQERFVEVPGHIWRPSRASANLSSNISSLKMYGKNSDGLSRQHLMITSLGSEASGGSVYTLNLSEPLDCDLSSLLLRRRIHKAASFNCTVWTADCNSDGSQAVVGTNLGAALVNLETGVPSWVFRCKSDVLSLQLDHPGKIVLCGLRNGAIVTVDTREKSERSSARLARHRIPYPARGTCKPSSRTPQNLSKPWFELQGSIFESRIASMPSSIACLASLKLDDQCFLASSMDGSDLARSLGFENGLSDGSTPTAFSLRSIDWESGSLKNEVAPFHTVDRFDGNDFKGYTHLHITIRLYDQRLMQRGPVQFYEGNVNSHTRIQLGVDPYERCFMSGGEDCNLRIWCIKSGELLFEDKFMNSVPSVVCWPGELPRMRDQSENHRDCAYGQEHSSGAWLGSEEGIFHVRWS